MSFHSEDLDDVDNDDDIEKIALNEENGGITTLQSAEIMLSKHIKSTVLFIVFKNYLIWKDSILV